VLLVAVARGSAFDRHDLAVEALRHRVGNPQLAVGQDVVQMGLSRYATSRTGSNRECVAHQNHFAKKRFAQPREV
jgi:hypothetical protein